MSNRAALCDKYGPSFGEIETAVRRLERAGAADAIASRIVWLDDPRQMRELGIPAVESARDEGENLRAIRDVCATLDVGYLTIVGSTDIIPHQSLPNPAEDVADECVPADRPYGMRCEQGPSDSAPQVAVGRLPGVTGVPVAGFLLRSLRTAALPPSVWPSSSEPPFILASQSFARAAELLAEAVLPNVALEIASSPDRGPEWSETEIGRNLHILKCHGSPNTPRLAGGRSGESVRPALFSRHLAHRLSSDLLVACVCCYGASLYQPLAGGLPELRDPPICNAYLGNGARTFLGSTCAAFGGRSTLGPSDWLVVEFLRHALRGERVGDALTRASGAFTRMLGSGISGRALKTLQQFILLGDPTTRFRMPL